MDNIKKFIKGYDLFGHPINLKFGKEGHEYKTFIGGFVSFLIKCFMKAMIFGMTYNMIMFKRNSTSSNSKMLTNTEMLEITNYS
jgi:hypothetical protein